MNKKVEVSATDLPYNLNTPGAERREHPRYGRREGHGVRGAEPTCEKLDTSKL